MTIEEVLSRLAINTGRIADALEAIASNQGIVREAPEADEEKSAPAKKPAAKKKASKKKASKKTSVGKKEEESKSDLTLKDDVRPVLKRLRDEVSHAAVKSLLKKYGASTVPQLAEKHFENIVADAMKEIGDDNDDADDIDDDLDDGMDLDDDDL